MTGTELIGRWLDDSPFVRHLGMRVESLGDGTATVVLPFGEPLVTIGDVVHGGAVSALVDSAATAAAWAGAEAPENMRGTTVGLTVSFVAAARGSDLTATARVVRRGNSLCFCDVEVTDAGGQVVAKGLVTYKLG